MKTKVIPNVIKNHREVRQSEQFASYLANIGWTIENISGWSMFIRTFPLIGSIVKAQRIPYPFPFEKIIYLRKKYRAYKTIIEVNHPAENSSPIVQTLLQLGYKKSVDPHAPSKTIHIDLSKSEDVLFGNFTEAKRRGVRRALNHGIAVEQSHDIDAFVSLKWGKDPIFSFLIRKDHRALWKNFSPNNARILFAYKKITTHNTQHKTYNNVRAPQPVAGILLLFYDHVAYYWQAAATREGKKFFAPTLLVWEALKLAKKKNCVLFDFEGVADERFPKASKHWHGFTKFKEGFGGTPYSYMEPFIYP